MDSESCAQYFDEGVVQSFDSEDKASLDVSRWGIYNPDLWKSVTISLVLEVLNKRQLLMLHSLQVIIRSLISASCLFLTHNSCYIWVFLDAVNRNRACEYMHDMLTGHLQVPQAHHTGPKGDDISHENQRQKKPSLYLLNFSQA